MKFLLPLLIAESCPGICHGWPEGLAGAILYCQPFRVNKAAVSDPSDSYQIAVDPDIAGTLVVLRAHRSTAGWSSCCKFRWLRAGGGGGGGGRAAVQSKPASPERLWVNAVLPWLVHADHTGQSLADGFSQIAGPSLRGKHYGFLVSSSQHGQTLQVFEPGCASDCRSSL